MATLLHYQDQILGQAKKFSRHLACPLTPYFNQQRGAKCPTSTYEFST